MSRKIRRAMGYFLACFLIVAGVLTYTYPLINRYTMARDTETELEAFHSLQKRTPEQETQGGQAGAGNTGVIEDTEKIYDPAALYEDMKNYNEEIYENGQSGLTDAWSYEQAAFDLSAYGVYDLPVAELRIPKMDVDLPVYLGASRGNMARGAAQLGQTSMPIGGKNTNCVIAGHRGSSAGKFFLDIENLEPGDKVYIDNLWETLTYCVCKTAVISPDEVDKVLIQEDRDMVTLITCHPYPYNYQRYVVYCERVTDNGTEAVEENTGPKNGEESNSQLFIEIEYICYCAVPVLLVVFAVILLRPGKNRRKRLASRK